MKRSPWIPERRPSAQAERCRQGNHIGAPGQRCTACLLIVPERACDPDVHARLAAAGDAVCCLCRAPLGPSMVV
jgi:hypothetical protein